MSPTHSAAAAKQAAVALPEAEYQQRPNTECRYPTPHSEFSKNLKRSLVRNGQVWFVLCDAR